MCIHACIHTCMHSSNISYRVLKKSQSFLEVCLLVCIHVYIYILENIQNLIWKKAENDSLGGGKQVPHSGTKTFDITLESSQNSTHFENFPMLYTAYANFDLVPGWAMWFSSENARAPTKFWDPIVYLCMCIYDLIWQKIKNKRTSIHACMYIHIHTYIHASLTHKYLLD